MNGPALRHIRTLTGLNARQLAVEVGVTPDYIRKIENGISKQVGPALFVRLMTALRIDDRRVLLADPWGGCRSSFSSGAWNQAGWRTSQPAAFCMAHRSRTNSKQANGNCGRCMDGRYSTR